MRLAAGQLCHLGVAVYCVRTMCHDKNEGREFVYDFYNVL